MSKSLQNFLKIAISLALGIAIIWLLYRKTDFNELMSIVRESNLSIILFSLVFGLCGHIVRSLRWGVFLNSLGYRPNKVSLVLAMLGNYAVNFLIPRGGDIWRCAAVSRYDKIPFSKTLETFLVDKMVDFVTSAFLVLLSVILYIDFFISYFRENPDYGSQIIRLLNSPWLYVAIVAILIGLVIMFTVFKNTRPVQKIYKFLNEVFQDMKIIAHMKEKKQIILYTILGWICFYLFFYVCFYAFDFTKNLGPVAGLVVFSMCNVGILIPTQGGMGPWHFMAISSLVILGVAYNQASAFAGAVFTIQSIWIIVFGALAILALPYVKRDIRHVPESSENYERNNLSK